MAGLVTAARLRELGHDVTLLEKGDRPGGSMLLSSGVIWRHRSLDDFHADCPDGDPALQRLVIERLDDGLDWLEHVAGPATGRETGNERTVGRRFTTWKLTEGLVRAAGEPELSHALAELLDDDVVLATGGFAARLARERGLPLRAVPWSDGDGLRLARERGAAIAGDLEEFYGRALPAPPADVGDDWIRTTQLYGRFAHVVDDRGTPVFTGVASWSESDIVQAIARQPGGTAWYVIDSTTAVRLRLHDHWGVGDMIFYALEAGGEVRNGKTLDELGLGPLSSPKLATPGFFAIKVVAAVTHTLGGVRVDDNARVLSEDGRSIDGLYAAGVDVGGIASGGYASGLAQALVFGLAAAESIVSG
jgi:succinate dehydrogenase/fumarate reductase flavoprotein subunit